MKFGRSRAAAGIARFLVLFAVAYAVGHGLLGTPWGERGIVGPWTRANLRAALGLAHLAGIEAHAEGRMLVVGRPLLEINKGCDGLDALLIVASAILAFPAAWRLRLAGLLGGAAAVFAVNALRVTSLLWVALRWPERLEFVHVDVWQPAMMLFSFGLFLVWGVLLARDPERAGGAD